VSFRLVRAEHAQFTMLQQNFKFFAVGEFIATGTAPDSLSTPLYHCREGVWKFFVDKCAENLHVVLSMSPSGDSLRNRCRSFPGLVGNTTIDWIFPWPKEALKSVARVHISENRKIPDSYKDAINEHVVHVHESLRHYTEEFFTILRRRNYITPKHYLDYVTTYIRLLDEKSSFITQQIARFNDGIKKIDDASAQIDLLRVEVEKTKRDATKAAAECDSVLADINDCKTLSRPSQATRIFHSPFSVSPFHRSSDG
jgi:dynein heavy chain, axonemal